MVNVEGYSTAVHCRLLRGVAGADDREFASYGLETEDGIVAASSLPARKNFFHLPAFGSAELHLPNVVGEPNAPAQGAPRLHRA